MSPRNLKILLAVSVLVNVFVLAAICGGLLMRHRLLHEMGPGHGNPMIRAAQDMPEPEQQAFHRQMRAVAARALPAMTEARNARNAAADGLVAAKPDAAKIRQDLARARAAETLARGLMEDALVQFAVTLEPKARERMAEGLRRAAPRPGRHMMMEGPPGPPPPRPLDGPPPSGPPQ
jgi:uncharacterized membrane protein